MVGKIDLVGKAKMLQGNTPSPLPPPPARNILGTSLLMYIDKEKFATDLLPQFNVASNPETTFGDLP